MAFPGYMHCRAPNLHQVWTWWVPLLFLCACNLQVVIFSSFLRKPCWLHWILNRSLSEVHAVVADHILDGGRLASRALPSCLDFQNLPNNDKEKVINCDQNYLFASILCPIQCCRVHKKIFKLCTCSGSRPWWSEEDYPWEIFMPCSIFHQRSRIAVPL